MVEGACPPPPHSHTHTRTHPHTHTYTLIYGHVRLFEKGIEKEIGNGGRGGKEIDFTPIKQKYPVALYTCISALPPLPLCPTIIEAHGDNAESKWSVIWKKRSTVFSFLPLIALFTHLNVNIEPLNRRRVATSQFKWIGMCRNVHILLKKLWLVFVSLLTNYWVVQTI